MQMRRRKLFISFFLALAIIISPVLLGWSIADELWEETTVYSLHLAFGLYLFSLSARSVRQDDADLHTDYIIHLSVLSTLGFLLLGGSALLPESPPPSKVFSFAYKILWPRSVHEALMQDPHDVLRVMWYSLILTYAFAWVLIIRTPLGPPLHYPVSNIYSETTVKSISNMDKNNVCGMISLLFSDSLLELLLKSLYRWISVGFITLLLYYKSSLAGEYCEKP